MKFKELILKYITAFNNQDLNNLRLLFDKNINLQDWELNEKGIENVIQANKNIFNSSPNLKVKINNDYYFKNTAICVLKIKIDSKNTIDVVDIIKINKDFKIIDIKAYKG